MSYKLLKQIDSLGVKKMGNICFLNDGDLDMRKPTWLILLMAVLSLNIASSAFADDGDDADNSTRGDDGCTECRSCSCTDSDSSSQNSDSDDSDNSDDSDAQG